MNPTEDIKDASGTQTASSDICDPCPEALEVVGDSMKRVAARQLIERYYYQLTDGCGNSNCENSYCASCPNYEYKDIDKNKLALHALDIGKNKDRLCENQGKKVAKVPVEEQSSSKPTQCQPLAADVPSTSNVHQSSAALSERKFLTESIVINVVEKCKLIDDWTELRRIIGCTYNSPDSLMISFRLQTEKSKESVRSMEIDQDRDIDEQEIDDSEKLESLKLPVQETVGPESSIIEEIHVLHADVNSEEEVTLDFESLRRTYKCLSEIPESPFFGALINALLYLTRMVTVDLKYHKPLDDNPNYLNIFFIIFEIPFLQSPEFLEKAFPEFCKTFAYLPIKAQAKLAHVWSKFSSERLAGMVQTLQQLITVKLINGEGKWGQGYNIYDDDGVTGATRVLKVLYYASLFGGQCDSTELLAAEREENSLTENNLMDLFQGAMAYEPKEYRPSKDDPLEKELGVCPNDCRKPLVPLSEFINETLNEYLDIGTDYTHYRSDSDSKFSFVNHNFILTTLSKHMSMYFDNKVRMLSERRTSLLQTLIHGLPPMPFLKLRVRRDHLIQDALVSLEMAAMENPQDLKKQLYVEFEGEQGLDEGGVSKEFFQLIVEEVFNPDFGMFVYNESTCNFWFNATSFENDGQFTLIGIVLGLAIYNSAILDIHFPMVVYRKLMGKKGTFVDLQDLDPVLYKSLQDLLNYEGDDVEDVFMQTFLISYKDVFGNTVTHPLKDNGDEILVTNKNREEFVNLYADFILNKSVERQFGAFKRGFHMVTNESPLRMLFKPDEIELLVCGSENFDFHALEDATEYDGGYTKSSENIKYFWEIVHEFSETQKRKLLQFTTGSDRVPIGGLSKLKLIIARNGPDSDRLPTSHTCFNVLLLPEYNSKEKLHERLLKAITYSKGFGML